MNISLTVPTADLPDCVDSAERKSLAFQMAEEAAKAKMHPSPPPLDGENYNLKIYLNRTRVNLFMAGKPEQMSMSSYMAGLIHAMAVERRKKKEHLNEEDHLIHFRDAQKKLIKLVEAKKPSKIILAEAGTGIGKARVAAYFAHQQATTNGKPSVVAAPSISVLSQNLSEWHFYAKQSGDTSTKVAFLIGKNAFISPEALQARLNAAIDDPESKVWDDACQQAVQKWLKEGGPAMPGSGSSSLHEADPMLRWLAEDLTAIAPDFPVEDVLLTQVSDPETCPATQCYIRLREAAHSATIIYCTHAMLCLHTLKLGKTDENGCYQFGQAILPEYGCLIVDEAHLLEDAAANLISSTLNPRVLSLSIKDRAPTWSAYRVKGKAETLRKNLQEMHVALREFGFRIDQDRIALGGPKANSSNVTLVNDLKKRITQIMSTAQDIQAKTNRSVSWFFSDLIAVAGAFQALGEAFRDTTIWLEFSPEKRFPSIAVGPRSVRHLLARLWDTTPSALLLSGTMTLPDSMGRPSPSYVGTVLAIPPERRELVGPINQSWLWNTTLHIPDDKRDDLNPPTEILLGEGESLNERRNKWQAAIAKEILKISQDALGGILVLLTSYEDIAHIGSILADDLPESHSLIMQSRKAGIRLSKMQYEHAYAQGLKPIWLATGPAWTGLNLSNSCVPPEQDFLLTDLVIPKIPYGTNRSTTHQSRKEWIKTAERDRAALELKQGLGRLIRREGLLGRRIWMLDTRIHHPKTQWLTLPIRKMLETYPPAL